MKEYTFGLYCSFFFGFQVTAYQSFTCAVIYYFKKTVKEIECKTH